MTPTEYEATVGRTVAPNYAPPVTKPLVSMFHAALGMVTEAGELADNFKKAIFYGGRVFNTVNADEEVGDLMWYVMLYCQARGEQEGTTGAQHFARILAGNAAKLRARYPGKFETEQAEHRNVNAEISAMTKAME